MIQYCRRRLFQNGILSEVNLQTHWLVNLLIKCQFGSKREFRLWIQVVCILIQVVGRRNGRIKRYPFQIGTLDILYKKKRRRQNVRFRAAIRYSHYEQHPLKAYLLVHLHGIHVNSCKLVQLTKRSTLSQAINTHVGKCRFTCIFWTANVEKGLDAVERIFTEPSTTLFEPFTHIVATWIGTIVMKDYIATWSINVITKQETKECQKSNAREIVRFRVSSQ